MERRVGGARSAVWVGRGALGPQPPAGPLVARRSGPSLAPSHDVQQVLAGQSSGATPDDTLFP